MDRTLGVRFEKLNEVHLDPESGSRVTVEQAVSIASLPTYKHVGVGFRGDDDDDELVKAALSVKEKVKMITAPWSTWERASTLIEPCTNLVKIYFTYGDARNFRERMEFLVKKAPNITTLNFDRLNALDLIDLLRAAQTHRNLHVFRFTFTDSVETLVEILKNVRVDRRWIFLVDTAHRINHRKTDALASLGISLRSCDDRNTMFPKLKVATIVINIGNARRSLFAFHCRSPAGSGVARFLRLDGDTSVMRRTAAFLC